MIEEFKNIIKGLKNILNEIKKKTRARNKKLNKNKVKYVK